jgi:hypothetical protein
VTDLDVNLIQATWKRRYPAYQVEVFSVGKVPCRNGHYCTVDAKPVTKGGLSVRALDNIKIEEKDGSMTVTRRGSIQTVEPSSDNGTSTGGLHWTLDPWSVAPGLLYTGACIYTQHGAEVIYAYLITEGR